MRKDEYFATLILMLGFLAATLSGFFRQAALADQLGTGRSADIYLIAYSIPEFIFIAMGIILPAAFIPLFTEYRLRSGESEAWQFGLRVVKALGGLLIFGTLIGIISAPLYIPLLAPGFSPIEYEQTIKATRLMLPAMVLLGIAILIGSAFQVFRRFESTALLNTIYNVTFIVVLLAVPIAWLIGRTALGVLLGAAVALLIQMPLFWKHRHSLKFIQRPKYETKLKPDSIKKFTRLAGPLTLGYSIHHIIWFVDRSMATTLGVGSVATLNYGYRLALVIGQLSGLAVSTAVFPRLSEQTSTKDESGLQASLADLLCIVWLIGFPATCALIILREPLVQILYEHGAFDQNATNAVSQVLIWYALAVLADAICQPFWRVLYAWRSVWSVSTVNGIQTCVRILGNFILIQYFGLMGIAISAMIGLTVQVLILGWLTYRRIGLNFVTNNFQVVKNVIIASFFASIAMGLLTKELIPFNPLITILISGLIGLIIYVIILGYSMNWRMIQNGIRTYISPKNQ